MNQKDMAPSSGGGKAQGMLTRSVVYNGEIMTKIEVLLYLRDASDMKREINERLAALEECERQKRAAEKEMQRRPIQALPEMEKPTGLAALMPGRKQEYERWLRDAPWREEERVRREAEEDRRVEAAKRRYSELSDQCWTDTLAARELSGRYKAHMLRQVIHPDYRKDGVPEMLFLYLMNGRAQTLTEAQNLYHEEQYRSAMLSQMQEQTRQIERARIEQQRAAREMMEMQRERMDHIAHLMEETRDAAKDAKFYAELNFWMNL